MKYFLITLFAFCTMSFTARANDSELKKNFVTGDPAISSISALTFGPEGILFIGDSDAAQIVAVDLSSHEAVDNAEVALENVDGMIADLLGASKEDVQVTDMAVNPENNNIYLSVMHGSGTPILFRVAGTSLKQVPLTSVSHNKTALVDAVAEDATDKRGRSLRGYAISDLHYNEGQIMVSGLSNKEFASTFRSIDFPYNDDQNYSSLEIYHAAHGAYETHAPIKTFTTIEVNGQAHLIAGYTCTPLVVFPMSSVHAGEHVKGRTIAELGNWNVPLDIIEMERDEKRYLLMANSSRAVMKFKISDIEAFGDSLTERVSEPAATAGIDFINLPFVNVQQLAKLNDTRFLMLQRLSSGDLVLRTQSSRWL